MPAHQVSHEPLPNHVCGKMFSDQRRKLSFDVAAHAIIGRPRLLRRIDIEAGARPEIIGAVRIVRHILPRGDVSGDEDKVKLRAGAAKLTLLRGMGAGQPGKIPDTSSIAPCLSGGT